MVWDDMVSLDTGMLYTYENRMNCTVYTNMLDQVYQIFLIKMFNNNIPNYLIFKQDNSPCHTSKVSMNWCKKKELQ